MLDPAAIADKRHYEAKDIEHLYIRRTKISPEVTNEIGGKWRERGPSQAVRCPATPKEERVFDELTATWLGSHAPGVTSERRLFPYTLLKAFLSSHKALAQDRGEPAEERDRRAGKASAHHAQAARRGDHRRRLRQARRAGRQAQGNRRRTRQHGPRGRLLRERPHPQVAARGAAGAARAHEAGPGRHHARRVLRRSSRRRSSSVSRWRMSRCGSCSPATWPPRA